MAADLLDTFLLYNAKIWTSGCTQDSTWMTFSSASGLVDQIGRGVPPSAVLVVIPESRRVDGMQRRVLPGLHESHLHVAMYGQTLVDIQLVVRVIFNFNGRLPPKGSNIQL